MLLVLYIYHNFPYYITIKFIILIKRQIFLFHYHQL